MLYIVISLTLFVLSFVAGMMGLGVAFIATPVLGLFGFELKHVIMPWSLWLNGITAISTAIALARAKLVDWRTAVPLLIIATIVAPIGVWLLQFVSTNVIWWIYVGVLFFLAYRMAFPPKMDDAHPPVIPDSTRVKAGGATLGIGVFAGFLGVGPGFLMLPTLVMLGFTARIAAATTAVIVTLPSFSAFARHLELAQFDWTMLIVTSIAAVIGAQLGARFMAKRVKSLVLTRMFAVALVFLAIQRAWILLAS
ncbi:MAG TPA: sulfite exporter TauE/SafE family protein [Chloroflexota bacterium]|nr:sulfite exporter TauE/SafE family protein [Chloroflexota bacterium]